MKNLCRRAAFFGAALFLVPLFGEESVIELRPGDSSLVRVDAKVPAKSAPLVLKAEFPKGFSFDQSGFISRRFLAGKSCYTGKIVSGSTERAGYTATDITYTFKKPGLIKVKSNTDYELKMHLRHNIKGGDVRVLWRRGTKNGSGIGYAVIGKIEGASDWKTVTFKIHTGRMEETAMIWFQKVEGDEISGTIDMKTMDLFCGGKALVLNNNDFSKSTGGWNGGSFVKYNPQIKALRFRFVGKGTQGFTYNENQMIEPGTEFYTVPFFKVDKSVPVGDYTLYFTGNGINKKVLVKVRNNPDVKLKKLETAFWLAESPYNGWSASARKALENTAKNIGINTMYIEGISPASAPLGQNPEKMPLPVKMIDHLSGNGFKVFMYLSLGGEPYYKLIESYLAKYPESQAKDWRGTPQKRICPTFIRKQDNEYCSTLQNFLATVLKKSRLDGFFWDIEYLCPMPQLDHVKKVSGTVDGMCACFCRRCIDEFKKTYQISDLKSGKIFAYQMPYKLENIPEEVRDIITRYPMQWTQFALERTNFLVEKFSKTIKSIRPEAQMRSYTGRYDRGYWAYKDGGLLRWSEWCGIDYQKLKHHIDAVMGCHDLDFYSETEAHTLHAVAGDKKPLILDISTQGFFGEEVKDLYARIMHIFAFCEAQGVAFWGHWLLDGVDYTEIRRALKDAAKFEDILTEGRRFDSLHQITAPASVRATTRILGNKRVVFVLNQGNKTAQVTLKNLGLGPAAKARWKAEFSCGKQVRDPEKISFLLPGRKMNIIVLEDISYDFKR